MINHVAVTSTGTTPTWFPANLSPINQRFEPRPPKELLRWGLVTFGEDLALATGFGLTGIVTMHMVSQIRPNPTFFYLQTDLLFAETMALRDQLSEKLGVRFVEVHSGLSLGEQAFQYGTALWQSNPDLCCRLRKVEPLRRFLAGKKAWVTGIRRDQSATRAQTQVVEWDYANQVIKLNPLAMWTRDQVWNYIREHELPYNPLHDKGYPSIGCMPCTRAVTDNDDERAGRWAGKEKVECGIHIQPDGKIIRLNEIRDQRLEITNTLTNAQSPISNLN